MSDRISTVPRLALSVQEACDALGCGWDFFAEHVAPDLRVVRRGRRKLIAVAELERWLDANSERALPDATGIDTRSVRKSPANGGVRASRAPAVNGRRAA
jgi:hypothetical protein